MQNNSLNSLFYFYLPVCSKVAKYTNGVSSLTCVRGIIPFYPTPLIQKPFNIILFTGLKKYFPEIKYKKNKNYPVIFFYGTLLWVAPGTQCSPLPPFPTHYNTEVYQTTHSKWRTNMFLKWKQIFFVIRFQ